MRAFYLLILLACVAATLPLELLLRTRVYGRPRRLLLTLTPVVAVFSGWDVYAIAARHWAYDHRQLSGVRLGNLPLEELLFFMIIPSCTILTFEAVRAVRGLPAGDE